MGRAKLRRHKLRQKMTPGSHYSHNSITLDYPTGGALLRPLTNHIGDEIGDINNEDNICPQ